MAVGQRKIVGHLEKDTINWIEDGVIIVEDVVFKKVIEVKTKKNFEESQIPSIVEDKKERIEIILTI